MQPKSGTATLSVGVDEIVSSWVSFLPPASFPVPQFVQKRQPHKLGVLGPGYYLPSPHPMYTFIWT